MEKNRDTSQNMNNNHQINYKAIIHERHTTNQILCSMFSPTLIKFSKNIEADLMYVST